MEPGLKDLENSQSILQKTRILFYSENNTKGVVEQTFEKKTSIGMKDEFNKPLCSQGNKWDGVSRNTA